MVYNDILYKPASLGERFQTKVVERPANASSSGSNDKNVTSEASGQSATVLSFFGRLDDAKNGDRAIPVRKRTRSRTQENAYATVANTADRRNAPKSARPMTNNNVRNNGAAYAVRREAPKSAPRKGIEMNGSYARAYAAGERIRVAAANRNSIPRRRYAEGAVPSGALRRGRSNIPGARHAVLVTVDGAKERRSFIQVIKGAFADRHVAEHRVKKSPFPLGFLTLIGICAFMVMTMLFSFSQINECNAQINELKATHTELKAESDKLEVLIAEREDIRDIEKIAVEEIGMVSSDVVQSKFVSVSAADKVEVLRGEEAETEEGGFSALLSVIGEYFN